MIRCEVSNMNKDSTLQWLLGRKITAQTLSLFGITYENSIVIPIRDPDGHHLFNKHRRNPFLPDTGPKYWYDAGGKVALFAAEFIKDKPTVVVAEGELDALVLWSHNIPAVSSTGGAMTFPEHFAELLLGKEVFICLDNDETGARGAVKILKLLPEAKVIIIPDTAQVKDVTDYYARGGDLRALMMTAKQYLNEEDVRADLLARRGLWQSTTFHEAWLDANEVKEAPAPAKKRTDMTDEVEKAKAYPIRNLIKVSREKKAKCPFHNEKTASMHVYPDNHAFCFGCQKRADAIDIYMALNNCTFKEAMEKLNQL